MALTEITIQTHFGASLHDSYEDYESFFLSDTHDISTGPMMKIMAFLSNVREIVGIMMNVLFNQIKILIRQRVTYSREDFNFEEYLSKAMSDDRLVRSTLFHRSGKQLIAEFFKFQSPL